MKKPIKLYKVTPEVLEYYKLIVQGNTNTSDDMISKKLTRDILLSKKLQDDNGRHVYQYGRLLIVVEPVTNTIVEISNYTLGTGYWQKPMRRYRRLNEFMGIA